MGPERQCAVHDEAYPCDAIRLLDELELVELEARRQFNEVMALKARVDDLEDKIRRAVQELT
jgi:hypothetical protein